MSDERTPSSESAQVVSGDTIIFTRRSNANAITSLLLILLVGVSCPGCTVLGAAVGSAFNTPSIECDPSAVGSDLVGEVVEVEDRSGGVLRGEVVAVLEGSVVIAGASDLFAHSPAETLSIADIESLRVGNDKSGSDKGMMWGLIADALVIGYAWAGLGAISGSLQ